MALLLSAMFFIAAENAGHLPGKWIFPYARSERRERSSSERQRRGYAGVIGRPQVRWGGAIPGIRTEAIHLGHLEVAAE
jgi:hypothetical protein